jgi:hypothetical protein
LSKPLDAQERAQLDPVTRAAYDVYETVFQPHDSSLGVSEFGADLYADVRYVVVPSTLEVACMADISPEESLFEMAEPLAVMPIKEFRPRVDAAGTEVLYLTPEYEAAISGFLNAIDRADDDSAAEAAARLEFLAGDIRVQHGHWGDYWHIASFPEVSGMLFDEPLARAQAHYRIGYQGGSAYLERAADHWTIVSAGLTWIE